MTGTKVTLIEMIKNLPDDVVERLDQILRQHVTELLTEKHWQELYEQAEETGWFDEMVEGVEKQIAEGETSDLSDLLSK